MCEEAMKLYELISCSKIKGHQVITLEVVKLLL